MTTIAIHETEWAFTPRFQDELELTEPGVLVNVTDVRTHLLTPTPTT